MGLEVKLLICLAFSAIGLGYLVYGKRQRRLPPMLAGLALCVFHYFLSSFYLIPIIGGALMLSPLFFRE